MTGQIADIFKFKRNLYQIIGLSGEGSFHPEDYGLEPIFTSTACWRGYLLIIQFKIII